MQELFFPLFLQEGEEEEVGNLQLAWEMLEVAKVIYKRYESDIQAGLRRPAYTYVISFGLER